MLERASWWPAGGLFHDNRDPHRIGVHHLNQGIRNVSMGTKVARSMVPLTSTGSVIAASTASTRFRGPLIVIVGGSDSILRDLVAGGESSEHAGMHRNLAGKPRVKGQMKLAWE